MAKRWAGSDLGRRGHCGYGTSARALKANGRVARGWVGSAQLGASWPYYFFGPACHLALPKFIDFPISIQMLWLQKYKTSTSTSPKMSKLGTVIYHFKMDNFQFWIFIYKIQEQIQFEF
jgi:hypothetical protein